jgi:methylated-DNA-[protein]-cysteine S-methyltransferase
MELDVFGASVEIDENQIAQPPSEIRRQAAEYERGERVEFDLDVRFPDDFTGRVMRAMAEIPCGATRTYGDLAADLDTAPRAVGGACGRNPVPLVVPCHRVVGADGLVGYSAEGGLDLKHRLLVHEGAIEG